MSVDEETTSFQATIYGVVQGVNYRLFTRNTADSLGVTGWVRNRKDGSVQVVAQGEASNLHELISQLRVGPPHANVTHFEIEWMVSEESLGKFCITR